MLEAKIKQFDQNLAFPAYKTPGAAAFDVSSRIDIQIKPGAYVPVPLNVAIKAPEGYFCMLVARSSLHKKGLVMINSVGIGDSDYCGNEDEYMAVLYNFSKEVVEVEKGERIIQVVILPQTQVNLLPVENLDEKSRGGFGTTGKK